MKIPLWKISKAVRNTHCAERRKLLAAIKDLQDTILWVNGIRAKHERELARLEGELKFLDSTYEIDTNET